MGTIWRTVLIVTVAGGLIMSQVGECIQEQVCLIKLRRTDTMAKAKKPNEIREEMRKQMAAKYKQDVEYWKKLAHDRWENYMDVTKRLADMNDENAKLKEQIEAQKEWIERLMEFVNMPDEQRSAAVKEYVEHRQMSEQFRELFSPYFDALNRLNILSL